ncbi:NmrA family NAD(P)-binding protein [Hymenobacter metallicola]|uniref:NAD-dependent epimerase/dehydratase family protein n=1 Tax=Hymenobacter metallicola TaxID=2563114 RepID=A0A4Z0Q9Q7_9BACT|nr:NmrA family NAD(P)-binding protein [Hymenobacter metallicola]TGE26455.1 NAD-dependent epimerase/dehydratase family protein [Hymenobacter metallicola]
MSKHIVVLGATGHIGTHLTHLLLERGHRVTAVARASQRLSALEAAGAQTRAGSLDDTDFLTTVLREADAAFLMLPPNASAPDNLAYQAAVGESVATAVRAAGLRQAVNLSSIGAELTAGTGPIVGVHYQEQRLNAVEGLNVVHLRPAYFMENLLAGIGLIQGMGINGSATRPDVSFPMIATRDIAAYAAQVLEAGVPTGKSEQLLLGPRDYTMQEATAIFGRAIGRPELPYVQFSYDQARQGMLGAGLSESMADLYLEMTQNLNEGRIMQHEVRTPANTTPTTLEQFAEQVFVPAFQGAAQAAVS